MERVAISDTVQLLVRQVLPSLLWRLTVLASCVFPRHTDDETDEPREQGQLHGKGTAMRVLKVERKVCRVHVSLSVTCRELTRQQVLLVLWRQQGASFFKERTSQCATFCCGIYGVVFQGVMPR